MQIEVTGYIPRSDESVAITPEHSVFACRMKFDNGVLVGIAFDNFEYYAGSDGRNGVVICTRHGSDADKYPNWPYPEP